MDSFEFNKIAGAVLGMLLFVMGLGVFTDALFSQSKPAKAGYELASLDAHAAPAGGAPAAAAEPLPVLLAKGDAAKGAAGVKACAACHGFDKGGANKVGPNLYGVVGRPVGGAAGFAYSDTMKAKGGDWSFENLDKFIANPKGFISGTKMAYAGEKDAARRADIVVYLRSLADSPVALPK